MSVLIGSARIDERGRATGGKAGDQTGNEVGRQNWYRHGKGWRVLRPKQRAAAERIARCMDYACDNRHIGYDQAQRLSLYRAAEPLGFNVANVKTDVETDCSALVRVCCAYAGIRVGDFITSDEAATLLRSGEFTELTAARYTEGSEYLQRGDVLVTRTKGHTVVVLTDGAKAAKDDEEDKTLALGDRILRKGCVGTDVAELQRALISVGFSCGSWGPDGDFGDATELAVRSLQRANGSLEVDGIVGPKTLAALETLLDDPGEMARRVRIVGGDCWARSAPNKDASQLGVAHEGDLYQYGGVMSGDGWPLIDYKGANAWVSPMYAHLEG